MEATKLPRDWSTDSFYHRFPSVPGGLNPDVVKILTWLKAYDETCQEARAQMIEKIDGLLGITKTLK
jgi:hypothetical protein